MHDVTHESLWAQVNRHSPLLLLSNFGFTSVVWISWRISRLLYTARVPKAECAFFLPYPGMNKQARDKHFQSVWAAADDWGLGYALQKGRVLHAGKCSWIRGTSSPFHDDEQALFPMVHVFVEAQDAHYVRPGRDAPVQLHLPACFRAVVENLKKERKEGKKNSEEKEKRIRSGG